ncbi:MAG: tRNA (adenosine(37)-N6)-threonylcarbamoyltransferase complex ATPase subunit type 1 TsaE, partial [Clostridiales bacterium]|nr:tRNA (adenosine(37)-N6)-threonylcarbamoyltransferase complex ATPase subunit type 1 TsaE [Clostridiales bacterium]
MAERIFIKNEDGTREYGLGLAEKAKAGDVIALVGELGTGKTALTKYIAEGLGVSEDITSPTFTIIKEYRSGRFPLYHFDVYRLSGAEEMHDLGYWEYFYGDGVSVVEWADKIIGLIPEGSMIISMSYGIGESER